MAYEGPQEKEQFGEGAQQLTVRDRMNHAYLLANGILVFQKTTTNQKQLEAVVRETIMALFDIIPDAWLDKDFQDDIKKARTEQLTDVRPSFCGVRASEEWCAANKVPAFQRTVLFNHHLLMKACVNLLERRGLLSRKIFKEVFTGKRAQKKGLKGDVADMVEEYMQESTGQG